MHEAETDGQVENEPFFMPELVSSIGFSMSFFRSFKDEAALKRKSENDPDGMSSKNQRVDQYEDVDDAMDGSGSSDYYQAGNSSGTCDLIVLGIPFKASEDEIRDYFETFGELAMVQLKTKENGQSKGFAFIRYKDLDVQEKVLLTRHMIKER